MSFESRNGSPKKYYRWFPTRLHARLTPLFEPKAYICSRFALFPTIVDNKWVWLTHYYSLKTISSALNFGGNTLISYSVTKRSKSIFSFKKILKEKGVLKNFLAEKREAQKRFEAWPESFKEAFRKHFKKS